MHHVLTISIYNSFYDRAANLQAGKCFKESWTYLLGKKQLQTKPNHFYNFM